MFNITSDTLKGGSEVIGAWGQIQASKAAKKAANYTADRLTDNAKAVSAKAAREAKEHYEKGDILEGQAVTAMVSQGMQLDPKLIAKIKSKTSMNAMAALFEGESRAADLREQASITRYSGGKKHAANLFSSSTNLLTSDAVMNGMESFSDWMKNKSRPSGWNRSPF